MKVKGRGKRTRPLRFVAALMLAACMFDGSSGPGSVPVAISATELQSLVGALAHDSTKGRRASSSEQLEATAYVAMLADAYGLVPAGSTPGSYFHDVPGVWRSVGTGTVEVAGKALTIWTDFIPSLPRTSNPTLTWDAQAVYAGSFEQSAQAVPTGVDISGKAVVVQTTGPVLATLAPGNPLAQAAVVLLVAPPQLPDVIAFAQARRLFAGPAFRATQAAPLVLTVTPPVAERLMGAPLAGMAIGQLGGQTRGAISMSIQSAPMRNVVAMLPGGDPDVASEYVALGAHLDHIGVRPGAAGTDSIYNGADDNASGSAALLMLARHYATGPARPRRSLLFIWFDAEELGLVGSEAFTHAPTVPLESITAFVNLDMVSRGGAADIEGGGDAYLESIGSRRGSTQLAPIVDSVAAAHGMQLDYTLDAAGHPQRVFCRSDQWNFAKQGVPVVFFSTGLHPDYHGVDDEIDRGDFDKLARVTSMVGGLTNALASRPARLVRDMPAPDPNAACVQ